MQILTSTGWKRAAFGAGTYRRGNKGSHWDPARISLVLPIGVIVAVAIVCVVVAVLTSAQRADEVSFNRDQQLIRQAITDNGTRVLRQVDSIAGTPRAVVAVRLNYDPDWAERHLGTWLEGYFGHDVVAVFDGADHLTYVRFRDGTTTPPAGLTADLADSLNLLRGRLKVIPSRVLPVDAAQTPVRRGGTPRSSSVFSAARRSSRRSPSGKTAISPPAMPERRSWSRSNISARPCSATSAPTCR